MNSRDRIRHPGPETGQRVVSAMGDVSVHTVHISAGQILMEAVEQLMIRAECDSAVMLLDGTDVGPFDYVIPSYSNDGLHAAWYSKTHSCKAARLHNATAMIGKRDGAFWMHCHALWNSGSTVGMGHLLPDKVTVAADATLTFYAFNGGYFDVKLDPETAFSVFHVVGEQRNDGNAFIVKVNPHEDIYTALQALISEAGFAKASIFGIGSLIGASFVDDRPMERPISEVLVSPEAHWDGSLKLPMHCVDTENELFYGDILKGGAPVLVTFELLVVETIAKDSA